MLSVEIAFIAIAFISLPNLFYRAEFNVPLLLFAAVCWQNYTSSTAYLLIISWVLELYRLLTLLVYDDRHLDEQRKPLLLISTITAFVMKVRLGLWRLLWWSILYLKMRHLEMRLDLQGSWSIWLNRLKVKIEWLVMIFLNTFKNLTKKIFVSLLGRFIHYSIEKMIK